MINKGAAIRYAPPPADGSSVMAYRFAANEAFCVSLVRPRTGPQSAHLWWPAVAKL